MPWLVKTSRISCAWRYSNAGIPQPVGQVRLTPLAIIFHGIKSAERSIIEHGLVSANKAVTKARLKGSARRRLKFLQPLLRNGLGRLHHLYTTHRRMESKLRGPEGSRRPLIVFCVAFFSGRHKI